MKIKDFKDKGYIVESVNGIPLCNEDSLEYGVYYLSIKLDPGLDLDWSKLDQSGIQQYITDDTEVTSYWCDNDDWW